MEAPAQAGTSKFPYLEDIFEFSGVLCVMFLKTPMSDGPRYASRGHTVVMVQYTSYYLLMVLISQSTF